MACGSNGGLVDLIACGSGRGHDGTAKTGRSVITSDFETENEYYPSYFSRGEERSRSKEEME
jgi:hypothetical protein